MGVDGWPWSVNNLPNDVPLTLRDLVGRPIRVLKKGAPHTMEYVSRRVTFYTDDNGLVVDVMVEETLPGTEA
jgi:hypothetical protein